MVSKLHTDIPALVMDASCDYLGVRPVAVLRRGIRTYKGSLIHPPPVRDRLYYGNLKKLVLFVV